MDIWIGQHFSKAKPKILILGESWYGDIEPLSSFIPKWINRQINDHFFSSLFNATTIGPRADEAPPALREAWWAPIAFTNFVTGTVGPSIDHKPTARHFRSSVPALHNTLSQLKPDGVWIIGTTQATFSAPVIASLSITHTITRHPRSGIKQTAVTASWSELISKLKRVT